jgi:hypothetical protein
MLARFDWRPKIHNLQSADAAVEPGPVTQPSPRHRIRSRDSRQRCWKPFLEIVSKASRCNQLAIADNDPISDAAYIRKVFAAFVDSGVFHQAVREWNSKPKAAKTVANIRGHFMEAMERRRIEKAVESTITPNVAQTKTNTSNASENTMLDSSTQGQPRPRKRYPLKAVESTGYP